MEFRLLGPVEVEMAGAPVDIGPPRQRGVLAALAVDAGRPVPVATLVERVWGDATEPSRSALYVYVTNLRKVLATAGTDGPGTATVARRSGGYVLDVDPDRVDVHRFRRLAGEARQPGCPDPDRAVLLRQALDLWRGTPLADLPGGWPERLRQDWRQEYVEAATAWAGAALGTGDPGAAVDLLTELAGRYPLNESVAAALMRLLYATGRGAGALDHYERVRAHLADELGTDPGPELRALHRAVRRGEPVTAPRPRPPARSEVVPAQLPADLARFAGRADHLRQLDTLLTSGPETRAAAIAGTAGVGKTALAVHWAHRVADRFPDGQLYVNLRGFDPGGQVVDPATAVRGFLDAFQVPPRGWPRRAR